jgi:hypothetical protein
MAAIITTLIDKEDTNEIVRNKIATILAVEIANQKALAVTAGKPNPDDWFFNVFIERARPWEVLTDNDGSEIGEMPLVNVMFDSDSFDNRGSANLNQQRSKGVFLIDCYAHKTATSANAGDELTSKESDRIARLVRNILMFAGYTYLELRGVVERRYVNKRDKLQPDIRQEGFENIVVTRISFEVDYVESTTEATPEVLENVFGECTLSDTGQVLFEVDFDYT